MIASSLERFLVECRKTRAKAITLAKGHLGGALEFSTYSTVSSFCRSG